MEQITIRVICVQRYISTKGCEAIGDLDGVRCIVDDAIITGVGDTMAEALESHEKHLNEFLLTCQGQGVILKDKEFDVHVPRVVFMGHVPGADGVGPDP